MFFALIAFAAVLAATAAATGAVRTVLLRKAVLDRPNHRSSHTVPTPRGGGLAVVGVLLLAWGVCTALGQAAVPQATAWAMAAALGLMAISWLDDLKDLPARLRLLAMIAAVALGLALLPDGPVFQGLLPVWADRAAAAFLWLWFINLYNFMDGIDGISGSETAAIGLGLLIVGLLTGGVAAPPALAATIIAAGLGFLVWNWHPARIFLGDVGSVPLGFLLGWLLLSAAVHGAWAAALILPLYYLADASITLTRRLLRGEKIWQAHREHFYQKAARGCGSHAAAMKPVIAANLVLVALAAWSLSQPWPALAAAVATVAALLLALTRMARGAA